MKIKLISLSFVKDDHTSQFLQNNPSFNSMHLLLKQLERDMEQQTGSKLGKEYIMWNASLDEAQAGIKIARRNINNLRYADDTTLMAESEELKSLLMKVKQESEKLDLKLNIQKTKIMASSPITYGK